MGYRDRIALPWCPSSYTAFLPYAKAGQVVSARNSYCGAAGQFSNRAACWVFAP
jgi:hypothetical protein